MTWQNGWAFAGLAALAIPVLIHLLSRRNARVERFPTLRFLPASQSAPVRRTRITDPLLMVVRALIIAVAVAALAQPLRRTAARTSAAERRVVRAIVLDTSASMWRAGTSAGTVLDSARKLAASLASAASPGIVIATASPAGVLQGASSWLSGQNGRRELIIASDFQAGMLDSVDLRAVAPDIAIQLARIPSGGSTPPVVASTSGGIMLLTAPPSRALADAAMRAASPAGFDTSVFGIVIVYPDAAERARLMGDSQSVADPSMADAVVRLRRDPLVEAARAHAPTAQGRVNGREALVIFPSFGPGTLASAALISAGARAVAPPRPPSEQETDVVSDSVLATWERSGAPGRIDASDASVESDGRWLWLVALLLLGAETLMRRRPGDDGAYEVTHAG